MTYALLLMGLVAVFLGVAVMAKVEELFAMLDTIADGVNALEADIKELKAQVAAGQPVSQEQLDALFAKAQSIGSDIADTSDTEP